MDSASRHDFLDPDAVARGEALGLLARGVVEGYRVGEHRSPFRGFAIEFAQHREYTIGDDPRHLDWKVLGRTDRYYIKQYEQDTNFVAHLVIDASESMNYGSGKITKFHYAKALAACLAYIILGQRDAAALYLCDTEIRETMTRTDNMGKIHHIMDRLASFQATAKTSLAAVMKDIAQLVKARGMIILISDLFDDEEAFEKGLQQLRFGGSEVIVFQVMDSHELEFPFQGTVEFEGFENLGKLKTTPADFRQSYLKAVGAFRHRIQETCHRYGCHYVLADTGQPLGSTLASYLVFRQGMSAR